MSHRLQTRCECCGWPNSAIFMVRFDAELSWYKCIRKFGSKKNPACGRMFTAPHPKPLKRPEMPVQYEEAA